MKVLESSPLYLKYEDDDGSIIEKQFLGPRGGLVWIKKTPFEDRDILGEKIEKFLEEEKLRKINCARLK